MCVQYNDRTGLEEGDAKGALGGKHVLLDGDDDGFDGSTSGEGTAAGASATPSSREPRSPSLPPPGGHTERDALLVNDVHMQVAAAHTAASTSGPAAGVANAERV